MQKIKDKSRSEAKTQSQSPERSEGEAWGKKIKVSHLQTVFISLGNNPGQDHILEQD
jgi:hypothetical protein